jgi:hypothetical protein
MRGYYDDCKSGCLPLPAKEDFKLIASTVVDGMALADNRYCAFGDVDDSPGIDVEEHRNVDRSNGRPHAAAGPSRPTCAGELAVKARALGAGPGDVVVVVL